MGRGYRGSDFIHLCAMITSKQLDKTIRLEIILDHDLSNLHKVLHHVEKLILDKTKWLSTIKIKHYC